MDQHNYSSHKHDRQNKQQRKCRTCCLLKQFPTACFREIISYFTPIIGYLGSEKYTNVIAYIALIRNCHSPYFYNPAIYCFFFLDFVKNNFNKICEITENFSAKTQHMYMTTAVRHYDNTEHPHAFLLFDGNVDYHSYFMSTYPDEKWTRRKSLVQTYRKTHNDKKYANENRTKFEFKDIQQLDFIPAFHYALSMYPTATYVQYVVDFELNNKIYELVDHFILFSLPKQVQEHV